MPTGVKASSLSDICFRLFELAGNAPLLAFLADLGVAVGNDNTLVVTAVTELASLFQLGHTLIGHRSQDGVLAVRRYQF
jgi:hypothetical protein